MDDLASTQPVECLQHLPKYLASPVDPLASLKVVRGPDDRIVALRSAEREYPVVNNVPRMLPDMGNGATATGRCGRNTPLACGRSTWMATRVYLPVTIMSRRKKPVALSRKRVEACTWTSAVGSGSVHPTWPTPVKGLNGSVSIASLAIPIAHSPLRKPWLSIFRFTPKLLMAPCARRPASTSWVRSRHYSEPGQCASPRGSCSSGPCGCGSTPGTWSGCRGAPLA